MNTLVFAALALGLGAPRPHSAPAPLKVGVTLHAYYSWVKSVAGDLPIDVLPILDAEVDAGSYTPRSEDVEKLKDLDAIVVNGIGHDDFIFPMIRASGNTKLRVLRPGDELPLMRATNGGEVNAHSFISLSNAIQESLAIARDLSELRPELGPALRKNAEAYARRLRGLKSSLSARLAEAPQTRVVTVHDGYAYLLQELGLDLVAVLEPRHGVIPSPAELTQLGALLHKSGAEVVLVEPGFPAPLRELLEASAGARLFPVSTLATGAYAADAFERVMRANGDALVLALAPDRDS